VIVESQHLTALRRVAGLRYLSTRDLATLAEAAGDITVPPGSVVQHAGPAAPFLGVVVDGTAGLWRDDTRVGDVGPGEFVSNRPPLNVLTRGGRVVAQTPMKMLTLPCDVLTAMMDDKAIAATMLDSALATLRRRGG
jgi:hypothetical protein